MLLKYTQTVTVHKHIGLGDNMIDLNCSKCKRYLGEAETIVADLLCPNSSCKASTQFKILTADQSKLYNYKFAKPERIPKSKDPITNEDAQALKVEVS